MATTPEIHEPQIAAARAQAWRQTGDPLLTLEDARQWFEPLGLVPFAPLRGTLGAPAPSLVEATLGLAKPSVTLAEMATARTLTARLVGEGSALPLNLLGGPGDLPDFLVTAQAFPFVFTLRGDKGWKRPPETVGAVKVTPLALRVYELLSEKGAMPVAAIVAEVGREVTESAVARALGELWQLLRVIPVLQQGEGETSWELTTTRFLKAVKAGANAGQPTALSGLVSLYLGQALVATEEEIAGFLSPLTARSRIREVLHGLGAARLLTEAVIQGKTVVYVPEMLPDLAAFAASADAVVAEAQDPDSAAVDRAASSTATEPAGEGLTAGGERIRRFGGQGAADNDRKMRGKPVPRQNGAERGGSFRSDRPRREAPGGPRPAGTRGEGDKRPFQPRRERPARPTDGGLGTGADRPSFTKPWQEPRGDRPPRKPEGDDRPLRGREDRRPPRRVEGGEGRPSFRPRESAKGAPPRGGARFGGARGERGGRPDRAPGDRSERPAQRSFRPRAEGGERPFRPRAEGGERPFRPRAEGGERPFRPRAEGESRPFRPQREGKDRPYTERSPGTRPPYRPRPEGGGDRPFRPRPEGAGKSSGPRREGSGFRAPAGGGREGGFADRRGPARPPQDRFKGGRPARERAGEGAGTGESRPPRPPSSGGRPRATEGRPGGAKFGRGPSQRPAGPGGFGPRTGKPGPEKTGAKFAGRPERRTRPESPDRPPRQPRPEDEA